MSNSGDPQVSLTLNSKVVARGFASDGQDAPAEGQVASLTSTNNFINFCLTAPNLPLTNGQQITSGSCNPAPMGVMPSADFIPSCKFTNPKHLDVILAGQTFTVELAVKNFHTGFITNSQETYLSAPQVLSADGTIQGHASFVIEQVNGIAQTTPLDPKKFTFFRSMTAPAVGGALKANVTGGLPGGIYRLSTILRTQNLAPPLSPVEQRGSSNDVVYFTVTGKVPDGFTPAPSTDPSLDPKLPTPTSSPTMDEVRRSDRAGVIAGIVLGVLAAIILTIIMLFCRGRRRRAGQRRNKTVRPFLQRLPRASRLFGGTYLRSATSRKERPPFTESIPLSDIPSSHDTHRTSQESVAALREQSQAAPITMDGPTYQMFRAFLAAREQGVLPPDVDVPPSYEDIARSMHSIRRPNPAPNNKGR